MSTLICWLSFSSKRQFQLHGEGEMAQAIAGCSHGGGEMCSKLVGFVLGNTDLHIRNLSKTSILILSRFSFKASCSHDAYYCINNTK